MSVINKELYDALIEAKVSDEKATAASKSDLGIKENITTLRLDVSDLTTRLSLVEKLQWIVLAVVVGSLLKSFIGA